MNIIQELPSELIAIILQYHIPDEPCSTLIAVLNGPHRQSIIDAHTIIQTNDGITQYFFNGQLHREPNQGPAIESYYENGNILCRSWYINGKHHRENGPALEQYYDNGKILHRSWYINGIRHRENGPTYESCYENGNISYRSWYINGKLHRTNGYAHEEYRENGNISIRQWYINGQQLTEKEVRELKLQSQ